VSCQVNRTFEKLARRSSRRGTWQREVTIKPVMDRYYSSFWDLGLRERNARLA
jgi:hypothetical protein